MLSLRQIAAPLAALVAAPLAPEAATVIGGSDLLTGAAAAKVEQWLAGDPQLSYGKSLAFTNIFDKVAGDTSIEFHTAADGKGPTIFLAEATDYRDGRTHIIGGFNPLSWNATEGYHGDEHSLVRNAFIFNLTTDDRRDQRQNDASGQYATYNDLGNGPTFGGGHDIYIDHWLTGGFLYAWSYCPASAPDTCPNVGPNLMGLNYGGLTVSFGAIEVFTIAEAPAPVPLPPAVIGFATALAGLGGLALRRARRAA